MDDWSWGRQLNMEMRVSALLFIALVTIYSSFLCNMGTYKFLCSKCHTYMCW